jgi:hypothetical protein
MKKLSINDLRTGDLLFSSHPYCHFSKAIDLVTQTGSGTHYSHVGMVEKEGKDETGEGGRVYHSSPKKGVCCESIQEFIHADDQENTITVYRLREEFLHSIPGALNLAGEMLGEQYNHSFRFSAPGYYCSEFIYRIFAPWKIFELEPMTFKDPNDLEFAPHWIEYYQKLGISIPERHPGCNPNGLAASGKLQLIGEL